MRIPELVLFVLVGALRAPWQVTCADVHEFHKGPHMLKGLDLSWLIDEALKQAFDVSRSVQYVTVFSNRWKWLISMNT